MPEVSRDSDHARPPHPTFETCRLRLRTLRADDQDFLADLECDPDVMEFVHSGPLPRNRALKYAEAEIETARYRRRLHKFIVELREDGTRIGWVELSKFEGVFDPDEKWMGDDINLGFEFGKAYWGQGFASEGARAVLAHAFDKLHLGRVVAYTHKDNVRSARLLERLGFQQRASRRRKDMDGQECRLFALTAEAWRA
jgi:RimJ/RimL family protein N-acetyltransferase